MRRPNLVTILFLCLIPSLFSIVHADELSLSHLIDEALMHNRDILIAEARLAAAEYRLQQTKAFPDPMMTVGYQNEGLSRYNYGDSQDAQWIFSFSQTIPFFGKRALRGEMAAADTDSMRADIEVVQLKTISQIKELYYELSLLHKNLDIISEKAALIAQIENAALNRYATGTGSQQDVLMVQTEKYMLREKEEMYHQKILSIEAMLTLTLGRESASSFGKPEYLNDVTFDPEVGELIQTAHEKSPEIQKKQKIVAAAEAKVRMAQQEYYPDFTITAQTNQRAGEFTDMYSLMTTLNIPIYYQLNQKPAVLEAVALLEEAKYDLEAAKIMTISAIHENASIVVTANRLITLYRSALIPRAAQDFETTLTAYMTGKSDALAVIGRLRTFLDVELLHWTQVAEKQKGMARIDTLTGRIGEGYL